MTLAVVADILRGGSEGLHKPLWALNQTYGNNQFHYNHKGDLKA